MLTLYWIPNDGDPVPRLMVFDEKEHKYQCIGSKVKEFKNALKYTFHDTLKNRDKYKGAKDPWYKELPVKVNQKKMSQEVQESVIPSEEGIDRSPIDREELLEILQNNGIAYRKNQKTATLFEKLPDDIARNFKLAESSVEVQTQPSPDNSITE